MHANEITARQREQEMVGLNMGWVQLMMQAAVDPDWTGGFCGLQRTTLDRIGNLRQSAVRSIAKCGLLLFGVHLELTPRGLTTKKMEGLMVGQMPDSLRAQADVYVACYVMWARELILSSGPAARLVLGAFDADESVLREMLPDSIGLACHRASHGVRSNLTEREWQWLISQAETSDNLEFQVIRLRTGMGSRTSFQVEVSR